LRYPPVVLAANVSADPPVGKLGLEFNREPAVVSSWDRTKGHLKNLVFRTWTAGAVLAAYVYAWFYAPELLTWWKRTTASLIEAGCAALPYPWGDRIEATLGNFGLWVQITAAIIVFRILAWLAIVTMRRMWVGSRRANAGTPQTAPPQRETE
jgi:hypothetical protein